MPPLFQLPSGNYILLFLSVFLRKVQILNCKVVSVLFVKHELSFVTTFYFFNHLVDPLKLLPELTLFPHWYFDLVFAVLCVGVQGVKIDPLYFVSDEEMPNT